MTASDPVDARWEPFTPMEVGQLLRHLDCPWWLAGGYAIEHAVGRAYRPHGDVDVLVLRRDRAVVRDFLADWDVWAADPPGTLRPWNRGETLSDAVHDVWIRPTPTTPWKLQVMLDEADGEDWTSRRDSRIRRPVSSLMAATAQEISFLTAEIILFYKAMAPREPDTRDLHMVWPLLNPAQRTWFDRCGVDGLRSIQSVAQLVDGPGVSLEPVGRGGRRAF